MARIALVQPTRGSWRYKGDLGLGYIRAYLQGSGHTIETFDIGVAKHDKGSVDERREQEGFIQKIIDYRPDHVLVKVWGFDYESPRVVIEALEQRIDATYIIGGPTVTLRPEKSMRMTGADFGVVGDGIPTVDAAIAHDTMARGVASWKDGTVRLNDMAPFNPDNWPTPDLTAIKNMTDIPLVSSVGCSYGKCSFCYLKELYKKMAFRSAANVVEDIRRLATSEHRSFYFYDDNFLNKPSHLTDIVAAMDVAGLPDDVTISFEARADDILRSESAIKAAAHRVERIDIGAESFIRSQLERWQKGTTPEQNAAAFDLVLSNGIIPRLYHILADSNTDMTELRASIEHFRQNPFHLLMGGGFTPYTNYEEEQPPLPDYVRVYCEVLGTLNSVTSWDFFDKTIRQIAKARTTQPFQTLIVMAPLVRHLDTLERAVQDVYEGKKQYAQAVKDAEKWQLDMTAGFMAAYSPKSRTMTVADIRAMDEELNRLRATPRN